MPAQVVEGGWPALDRLIERLRTAPARTGSVISTIYGDAILPRGGSLALSDLLSLMARLGASEGVVRTAVSRLARDGVLKGRRAGRHSAYALTPDSEAAFRAAIPLIYGSARADWNGTLHLAFATDTLQRAALETAGFQALTPGVMVSLRAPADQTSLTVDVSGPASALPDLVSRAWPLAHLDQLYATFLETVAELDPQGSVPPLDAIAARIMLIHAWRRIALRDPRLPPSLLPRLWRGGEARARCVALYTMLTPASEAWLDRANCGTGPLPRAMAPEARWQG